MKKFDFDAFLSYGHASDKKIAEALEHSLRLFAKPWYKLRALRIFRDQSSLSANPGLWQSITSALDRSNYLIILASPAAASSPWVNKEIQYWLENRSSKHFLVVVTDGLLTWTDDNKLDHEATDCLPEAAFKLMQSEEPRWIDLRWTKGLNDLSLENASFQNAIADLAAPLHNKAKDNLIGEDLHQHRKIRFLTRAAIFSLSILTLGLAATAYIALDQRNQAQDERNEALRTQSLSLAELARRRAGTAPSIAVGLALNALPKDLNKPDRPYVPEAERALFGAMINHVQNIVLHYNNGNITAVNISVDGSLVATGTEDGTVLIWDAVTGQQLQKMNSHHDQILSLSFSPNGQQLLTHANDGIAKLWDINTGKQLHLLESYEPPNVSNLFSRITSAVFSPDGQHIITSSGTGFLQQYETNTGKMNYVSQPYSKNSSINGIKYSPDGKKLLVLPTDDRHKYPIIICDASTGQLLGVLRGTEGRSLKIVNFSPDGQYLITAGHIGFGQTFKGIAILWDLENYLPVKQFHGHKKRITKAVFSKDSHLIATIAEDIRLWSGPSAKEFGQLRAHIPPRQSLPTAIAISPTEPLIVTAYTDGQLHLRNYLNAKLVKILQGHQNWTWHTSFSSTGDRLLTYSSDYTARIWQIKNRRDPIIMVTNSKASGLDFSLNQTSFASAYGKHGVRLWKTDTGSPVATISGHNDRLNHFQIIENEAIAASYWDKSVHYWSTINPEFHHKLDRVGKEKIMQILPIPKLQRLILVERKGIWLWQVDQDKALPILNLKANEKIVSKAMLETDNESIKIAIAINDKPNFSIDNTHSEIKILRCTPEHEPQVPWRCESLRTLSVFTGSIPLVTFSPDGNTVVTRSAGNKSKVWSIDTGEELATIPGDELITFSSDGSLIAFGKQRDVIVWDRDLRERRFTVRETLNSVSSLAFSEDKLLLAVADKTIHLIDISSGVELAELVGHESHIKQMTFLADGRKLMTVSDDKTIRVWNLPPKGQQLLNMARKVIPAKSRPEQIRHSFITP